MNPMKLAAGCVLVGMLAACGSDGPDPVLSMAGAVEPVETAADQHTRSVGIAARSDSLSTSTVHGDTDSAALPIAIVAPSVCDGTRCTATEPLTGVSVRLSLGSFVRNLVPNLDTHDAVLTKNGITLTDGTGGRYGPDYRQYGAWMEHSGFHVLTGAREQAEVAGQTISVTIRGTAAGGELSSSRPSSSATWTGIMTGTIATEGGILQGDAMLAYDMESRTLDASFTNIVNVSLNAAHTAGEAGFTDVSVDEDGTFRHGAPGNLVRGGLYGPDHEEIAGIFEQHGILGAFGARQQQ